MSRILNLFRFYFKTEMLFGMSVQQQIYQLMMLLTFALLFFCLLIPSLLMKIVAILICVVLFCYCILQRNFVKRIVTCGAFPVVSGATKPLFIGKLSYNARRLILALVWLSIGLLLLRIVMMPPMHISFRDCSLYCNIFFYIVGIPLALMISRLAVDLTSIVIGERHTAWELCAERIEQPALSYYPMAGSIIVPLLRGCAFILGIAMSGMIAFLPIVPLVFVGHALITPDPSKRREPWISLWSMRLLTIAFLLFGAFIHIFTKVNYGIIDIIFLLTVMIMTLLTCEMTYAIIGMPEPENKQDQFGLRTQ